ncbi:MAG TPA: DUF1015 domain-containing protein, partial [Rubrobacter sp.]|nr:DUF1015 domain-containing protein [Rubrobacter sp.]
MVDFRPFRGLRYGRAAGDLSHLISPPYDVLTEKQIDDLVDRNPHNIIRLEHPLVALRKEPAPYDAAARLFQSWQTDSTLTRDGAPAFYAHRQQFTENGMTRSRLVLYGRLKLSAWEEGEVLPHEYTMAGPKEDRLALLSTLRANVSPLYLLYDDPDGRITSLVARSEEFGPIGEATADGETHVLRAIQEPVLVESLQRAFQDRSLYMADGHHRYETALAYCRQSADAAASFVLVGLTAGSDEGLSIHATHRLYSEDFDQERLRRALDEDFVISETTPASLKQDLAGKDVVFGLAGLDGGTSLLALRPKDVGGLASRLPDGPEAWRQLDVNLLQHIVLGESLGLDPGQPNQRGLSYVHSVDEAL